MKRLAPVVAATLMVAPMVLPHHVAPAHAAGGFTLILDTHMQKAEGAVLQTLANKWGAANNVTVKVVVSATGGFQQFATLAHSGKGPDLEVGIPDDNIGPFQLAGLLSPVPSGQFKPCRLRAGRGGGGQLWRPGLWRAVRLWTPMPWSTIRRWCPPLPRPWKA